MNIMLSRDVKIKSIADAVAFIKTTYRIEDETFIRDSLVKIVEDKEKVSLKKGLTLGFFKYKYSYCFTLDVGVDRGIILTIQAKDF